MELRPLLHDRLVCLSAQTQAWSGPADGYVEVTTAARVELVR